MQTGVQRSFVFLKQTQINPEAVFLVASHTADTDVLIESSRVISLISLDISSQRTNLPDIAKQCFHKISNLVENPMASDLFH